MGAKVLRDHFASWDLARIRRHGLHPFLLLRQLLVFLQRNELRIFVWKLAGKRDFLVHYGTGVKWWWRGRERWRRGRWGGRRVVKSLHEPVLLSGADALHIEGVSARPFHLVFLLAVGAQDRAFDFFSQPCRTHDSHSPLTLLA